MKESGRNCRPHGCERRFFLLVRCLIVLYVGAFAVSAAFARGGLIDDTKKIAVRDEGVGSGQFRSHYLTVDYSYGRGDGNMRLSGKVSFTPAVSMNLVKVRTFRIGVIYADAQGRVLGERGLATGYDEDPRDSISFSATFAVPAQTAAIAFTYTGQAHGTGFNAQPCDFWFDPTVR